MFKKIMFVFYASSLIAGEHAPVLPRSVVARYTQAMNILLHSYNVKKPAEETHDEFYSRRFQEDSKSIQRILSGFDCTTKIDGQNLLQAFLTSRIGLQSFKRKHNASMEFENYKVFYLIPMINYLERLGVPLMDHDNRKETVLDQAAELELHNKLEAFSTLREQLGLPAEWNGNPSVAAFINSPDSRVLPQAIVVQNTDLAVPLINITININPIIPRRTFNNPPLIQILRAFLNNPSFNPNTIMLLGRDTLLHLAAESGHRASLAILLSHPDTNPNVRNILGDTPLHLAAMHGHTSCLRKLLKCRTINPNMRNTRNQTALHLAAERGDLETISALLAHPNINPNLKNDYYSKTPLHEAIDNHRTEAAALLINHPATDLLISGYSSMPLEYALERDNDDIVRLLAASSQYTIFDLTKVLYSVRNSPWNIRQETKNIIKDEIKRRIQRTLMQAFATPFYRG